MLNKSHLQFQTSCSTPSPVKDNSSVSEWRRVSGTASIYTPRVPSHPHGLVHRNRTVPRPTLVNVIHSHRTRNEGTSSKPQSRSYSSSGTAGMISSSSTTVSFRAHAPRRLLLLLTVLPELMFLQFLDSAQATGRQNQHGLQHPTNPASHTLGKHR